MAPGSPFPTTVALRRTARCAARSARSADAARRGRPGRAGRRRGRPAAVTGAGRPDRGDRDTGRVAGPDPAGRRRHVRRGHRDQRWTGDAAAALDSALWTAAALLASEQVGLAEWCLTTTVAYLKERHQFGRPVGSFQALKHRLADLWQELALARAAARAAADTPGTSAEARLAAGIANSLCSNVAVHAAEECVQLHGGIGMTWEHPAHLYLKRAKADQVALGTPGRHRQLLAPLADLPA